jgi:hypothetical protein
MENRKTLSLGLDQLVRSETDDTGKFASGHSKLPVSDLQITSAGEPQTLAQSTGILFPPDPEILHFKHVMCSIEQT